MLLADGALGVVLMLLWVYCIIDAITSDEAAVRNLPKLTWVLIVVIFFDIGSLLWLVAGRPQGATRSLPYKGNTGIPPEYDRPGRAVAANPDDDAAFLAALRERAEEQRKRAAEQARRLRDQEDEAPPA
ncbi:MAG: PLDc N-terminal domain-containing protein [Mycobacteriales bacterium]